MIENIVLTLLQIKGINRKTILNEFDIKNFDYSFQDIKDLFRRVNIETKRVKMPSNEELQQAIDDANLIIEKSRKENIKVVSFLDTLFPNMLRSIKDAPVLLFYKGNIECANRRSVAIIGTRTPTEYGIKIARQLGFILGRDEYTVISGLAIGCDMYGHKGCVQAKGESIAVLAGGLDKVYPVSNRELAEEILDNRGCLISEYSTGTKPFPSFYVERDRLQSGLSDGVIVIETDVKGGTMHTVGYSLEEKRVLSCLQHPENMLAEKKTRGNQKLIHEGKAIPIKDTNDLLILKSLVEKKFNDRENININLEIKPVQNTIFDYGIKEN